eukprot:6191317-Pleurochrysis_carterae.AAC.2
MHRPSLEASLCAPSACGLAALDEAARAVLMRTSRWAERERAESLAAPRAGASSASPSLSPRLHGKLQPASVGDVDRLSHATSPSGMI